MKNLIWSALFISVILLLASCKRDEAFEYHYYQPEDYALISQYLDLPNQAGNFKMKMSEHQLLIGVNPKPVHYGKAQLGRVLFYDKNLSKDGTISCASCHKQEIAFADDAKVSTGVFGRTGDRNSIALGSVLSFSALYGTDLAGPGGIPFFWDNRAGTASEQNLASMTNPKEMDMSHADIEAAVRQQPYYDPLFRMAFSGDGQITSARVSEAIAEFVNAIGSSNSKFDREAEKVPGVGFSEVAVGKDFFGFTEAENRGKLLYLNNCAGCHSNVHGRLPVDKGNNGLDATTTDPGIGGITKKQSDMGLFKVPLLRNIELTAPYMHDGRFASLDEVIDHYSTGIQNHPNLSPLLKDANQQPKKMHFSAQEKSDLIAFLKTLTDYTLTGDKRFSNPFK